MYKQNPLPRPLLILPLYFHMRSRLRCRFSVIPPGHIGLSFLISGFFYSCRGGMVSFLYSFFHKRLIMRSQYEYEHEHRRFGDILPSLFDLSHASYHRCITFHTRLRKRCQRTAYIG
jgi:hypothetical protein